MNNISKPFYFGSYLVSSLIAGLFTIIATIIAVDYGRPSEAFPFYFISIIFGIYAFVIFAVLIYKMWEAIPALNARTTPKRAVGFLFIPIFNLYWLFQVLWGWSRDWNLYAAYPEGRHQRISEALPLSIVIICILNVIFGLLNTISGMEGVAGAQVILWTPNYVLIPIFIFKVCTRLNTVPRPPEVQQTIILRIARNWKQYSRVLISLSAIFLITAIGILAYRYIWLQSTIETEGEMVTYRILNYPSGRQDFQLEVVFEITDGNEYSQWLTFSSFESMERTLEKSSHGNSINLFYNPDKPWSVKPNTFLAKWGSELRWCGVAFLGSLIFWLLLIYIRKHVNKFNSEKR